MRFHLGALPDNFEPDEHWRPIVEPAPWMFQVLATPISLASGALFFYLWHRFLEFEKPHIPSGWETAWLVAMVISFPVLIMVHELIHAVFYPGYGLSKATLIGCWPSRMLFYAYHDGAVTRNRFLLVFVTPFLLISVLPLLIAAWIRLPEMVTSILAWFSIWNALFACGDVLGFLLILCQVPRRALVRNKSWRTFWQPTESTELKHEVTSPQG